MKKYMICILLFCFLCSLLPMGSVAANHAERLFIYVSPEGNDGAVGTETAPLATLGAARDKIRALKKGGEAPEKGFVVYLREGSYQMQACLELTEQDSGTADAPVVYRAYPGETVTLIGGVSIPDTAFHRVADDAVLNRIISEEAKREVLVADLHALGFENLGEPYWPGTYSYLLPWMTAPDTYSPELFVDGVVQTVARYPNEGFMTVAKVIDPGAAPCNWGEEYEGTPDYVPEEDRDPTDTFEITPDDERYLEWTTVPEDTALMYGYWRYDWADHTVPLKKVYPAEKKLESAIPSLYSVVPGQRFYVFNLPEEIDLPGEYFLDYDNGLLYLYPPKNLSGADIKFSLLKNDMILINGAEYVSFKDIKMTTMRSSAVNITAGNNIEIRNCEFEYTADYAVMMEASTRRCGVIDSYFHDVNGGVFMRSGNVSALIPGESYVRNSQFKRFDRINKTYRPAVQLQGCGNVAVHNEMSDAAHCAIQFAGNDHCICYNEIYDVCKHADDMGAIYSGRSWVARGTHIKNNYIHDIKTDSTAGTYGLMIIYFDDRLCDLEVSGNLIVDVQGDAFLSNGGRDNRFYNNVLVNVEKCYRFNSLSGNETVTLMNSLKSVPYQNDVWRATYPELYTILEDEPNYPKNCYAGNNLIVNCGPKFIGGAGIHPEAYSRGVFNQDLELPSVDFIDPANGDYRLPEDSVVFERLPDFEQLQIEQMGRYTKRAEEAVQASVVLAVDSPKTYNGGLKTDIESGNTRVVPSLVDGEIFVPLRFLAEIWGMDVTFYPETGQVVLLYQGNKLALVPGNCRIQKNSTEVLLASAPFISEEGRTMVPLQMMEDVLDKTVYQNDNGLIALNDGEPILHGAADSYLADFLYNNLTTY